MNRWAASGKYDCHFLCICVLGDSHAIPLSNEMSRQTRMTHCVNAYIDKEDDLPTHGQLGCRGFIILDENHSVVSPGTSAFMEVRDLAFAHVEALLDAVCAKKPLPHVCPGEMVELLEAPPSRPDLKGSRGICVKLSGDTMQMGFVEGPLRGRAMDCPVKAVKKLGEDLESQGGCAPNSCGPNGCGPNSCGPNSCGPNSCGPNSCDPSKCDKQDCKPNSCGPNGCDPSKCDKEPPLEQEFVESSLNLVSVQVPSMDAEHEECAATLRRLAEERSAASLEAVLQCLTSHFEHEEALFDQYGFGGASERFSAKKSHIEDHHRLLDRMRRQLSETPQGIPNAFVRELLQDFHEHTSKYDSQYGEQLSAKGAQ